jgi:serine protease AprX
MQANRWSRTSWSVRRTLLPAVLAAAAGAVLAAPAANTAATTAAIEPELAARMARDQALQRYPVILRLRQQADAADLGQRVAKLPQGQRGGKLLEALKAFNAPLQAPLLKELAVMKAEAVQPLTTVNAIGAQLLERDIQELARRGDIVSIRYDLGLLAPSRRLVSDVCKPARPTPRQRLPKSCFREERAPATANAAGFDPQLPASATLQALGAPQAWQSGATGKGVTVAVVDTGVDAAHPDLAGSFRGGAADWFDVHGEHKHPLDRHGHGTQITGLVVGAGASGQTLGVAPQAKWIAARVYNDRNIGRLTQLHRVMAWLLDPDGNPGTADAPQIVLNAWGLGDRPGTCDEEFAADLRWLRAAGMHVVFAAGNGGPTDNSSVSPANNAGVLAVGASDAAGELALFSSRGVSACDARTYPDLLAPGETLRTTDLSAASIATTTVGTGTSYAAALVAGELALLTQARPALTVAERESLLRGAPGDRRPALPRALGLSEVLGDAQAGSPPRLP